MYKIHVFLTSALVGDEWSASRPGRFYTRRKIPRYPLYRRLGEPQSLSAQRGKKILHLPGRKLRHLGHPARSQSLYQLRYRASPLFGICMISTRVGMRILFCYLTFTLPCSDINLTDSNEKFWGTILLLIHPYIYADSTCIKIKCLPFLYFDLL
jgi:hypothetical protein